MIQPDISMIRVQGYMLHYVRVMLLNINKVFNSKSKHNKRIKTINNPIKIHTNRNYCMFDTKFKNQQKIPNSENNQNSKTSKYNFSK